MFGLAHDMDREWNQIEERNGYKNFTFIACLFQAI